MGKFSSLGNKNRARAAQRGQKTFISSLPDFVLLLSCLSFFENHSIIQVGQFSHMGLCSALHTKPSQNAYGPTNNGCTMSQAAEVYDDFQA
jgi:hypothetical protein